MARAGCWAAAGVTSAQVIAAAAAVSNFVRMYFPLVGCALVRTADWRPVRLDHMIGPTQSL
jgi:hypothetical protein